MADETYYREELDRRTEQITGLKGHLEDWQDRVGQMHSRRASLSLGVTNRERNIEEGRASITEVERRTLRARVAGEVAQKTVEEDAADNVAEAETLRRRGEEAARAVKQAEVQLQERRRETEQLHVEASTARGRFEGARADAERQREQMEREELETAETRHRIAEGQQAEARSQLRSAEASVAAATAGMAQERSRAMMVDRELQTELAASQGLDKALRQTAERGGVLRRDVGTLEQALQSLSGGADIRQLERDLATGRFEVQRLRATVADMDGEAQIRRESMEGALDETRRMLSAQKEALPSEDPALPILRRALSEALREAEENQGAARAVARERSALVAELAEVEARPGAEEAARAAILAAEVEAARAALDAAVAQGNSAEHRQRALSKDVAEARQAAALKEQALRSRLKELWSILKHQRDQLAAVGIQIAS